MTALLAVEDVAVAFGGVRALSGVSLQIHRGEVFAVIGPNGAGKTTLFNAISGLCRPERGRISINGREVTGLPPHRLARLGLSRTFQNLQIFFRMSAAENVMVGRHMHEDRDVLAHMLALPSVLRQNRQTRKAADELWHSSVLKLGLTNRPEVCLTVLSSGSKSRARWLPSPVF